MLLRHVAMHADFWIMAAQLADYRSRLAGWLPSQHLLRSGQHLQVVPFACICVCWSSCGQQITRLGASVTHLCRPTLLHLHVGPVDCTGLTSPALMSVVGS